MDRNRMGVLMKSGRILYHITITNNLNYHRKVVYHYHIQYLTIYKNNNTC